MADGLDPANRLRRCNCLATFYSWGRIVESNISSDTCWPQTRVRDDRLCAVHICNHYVLFWHRCQKLRVMKFRKSLCVEISGYNIRLSDNLVFNFCLEIHTSNTDYTTGYRRLLKWIVIVVNFESNGYMLPHTGSYASGSSIEYSLFRKNVHPIDAAGLGYLIHNNNEWDASIIYLLIIIVPKWILSRTTNSSGAVEGNRLH